MGRLADRQLDELVEQGGCEFIGAYAAPFTLLVIADLEGVPESDHGLFADRLTNLPEDLEHKPLEFLYEQFTTYIEDRRREPRDDIMTAMATATFPDGSTPEVNDVALLAANLFSGGQETTVRLLSFALRILGERPDIQDRLRGDRDAHPELHRGDAAVREPAPRPVPHGQGDDVGRRCRRSRPGARCCSCRARPTGTRACSTNPAEFDLDRENARYHVAFGHGIHHCAGAHLARAEGRVTINRLLDRTSNITISEAAARPGRRPALRRTSPPTSCAGSPPSTSSSSRPAA